MNMPFKAVIFDLDGTLLDTIDDIADAVNEVLTAHGFPAHGIDAYKLFVGAGVDSLIRQALPPDARDERTMGKLLADLRVQYHRHIHIKTKPYDGVPELLRALEKRRIAMAIHTNKPHDDAVAQIAYYLKDIRFACIEGSRPGVPDKPNPLVTLDISRRMGIDPHSCIFMGDSDIDMQTAVNAGMHPVGALWGFRSHEELARNGAATLIAHPAELLTLVIRT